MEEVKREETRALAVAKPMAMQFGSVADKLRYCNELSKANMLPAQYRGQPGNVLVAVEYGEALGLPPIIATQHLHVVEGRVGSSAALIQSLVRRAGHRIRVSGDDQSATCVIRRSDDPDPFTVTFTIEDARRAELLKKDNWRHYPMAMLKARATTQCARDACQEALCGVCYTPDELGAVVVDGEPVTVSVMRTPPSAEKVVDQAQDSGISEVFIIGGRSVEASEPAICKALEALEKLARAFPTEQECQDFLGILDLSILSVDSLRKLYRDMRDHLDQLGNLKSELAELHRLATEKLEGASDPAHLWAKCQGYTEDLAKADLATVRRLLSDLKLVQVKDKLTLRTAWFTRIGELSWNAEPAYAWAAKWGWVHDTAKGRVSFNLTPASVIQCTLIALRRATPELVEKWTQTWTEAMEARRLSEVEVPNEA